MMADITQDKPRVKLLGKDGNAFNLMGICQRAAINAKWPQEHIDAFLNECMSGDYENLLRVCSKHFDVH